MLEGLCRGTFRRAPPRQRGISRLQCQNSRLSSLDSEGHGRGPFMGGLGRGP